MCRLCGTEAAQDPWTVCCVCIVRLPIRMRQPMLSPAGVAVCLDLRARLLAGERPAEVPVSLVVVDGDGWGRTGFRPKRHRRAA